MFPAAELWPPPAVLGGRTAGPAQRCGWIVPSSIRLCISARVDRVPGLGPGLFLLSNTIRNKCELPVFLGWVANSRPQSRDFYANHSVKIICPKHSNIGVHNAR